VNNLHIITIYNLHNKVVSCTCRARCVERVELDVSSRAVRQARHSQNAWARHVERVESCRVDVTSRVEFGLNWCNYMY